MASPVVLNLNLKNYKQNITILYDSFLELQVKQFQRKLIVYGQTKWYVLKFDENIDYSLNNYEKRLNSIMRSSILICFMTQSFCHSDTLKKELFMVKKMQKNKKIIFIYLEKIPFYMLFYEKNDLLTNAIFILDGISLKNNDYEENLRVIQNFIKKTVNGGFEGYKGQPLLNENYYFSRMFGNSDEFKRPVTSIFKNSISPNSSTFKKHFELIQKKYENLLELYSSSYNYDRNSSTNDNENALNMIVKFDQIENEIEVLLQDSELSIGYSIGEIQFPNPNSIILMNFLMNFYYLQQFIVNNLINDELFIYNQMEYKSEFVDRNRSLVQLSFKRSFIFDQQIKLIKKQILIYETELINNLAKTLQMMDMEMKDEGLLNQYLEIVDLDKKIEQKETSLTTETSFAQRLCKCLKDERVLTLEEKLEKLKNNKADLTIKLNKNTSKIKKYYSIKQISDFVQNSKIELEWLEEEKENAYNYARRIEKIQYAQYTIQVSSQRIENMPFSGHFFIQIFESQEFSTPKVELNRVNSLKTKETFNNEELDEFEVFTWKLDKVQYIKIFLQSEDELEELFIKFIVLNTPDKGKITFKVDRVLSKYYADCETEIELWGDKMIPDKVKLVPYQIAVCVDMEIEKSIEFLIQFHGDKGSTGEISFINPKSRRIDKNQVILEKTFSDYFVGEMHTMVLYSRNFQYIYVHNVTIKLAQKIAKFNFDKWLGKQTGNGNVKYIKFGNDEELRPTSRILGLEKMPSINEFIEEEEID